MSDELSDRFTVKLGKRAREAIEMLSGATGTSEAKTLMSALGFYLWAYREWRKGNRIAAITESEDGDEVQFVRLSFMGDDDKDSNSGQSKVSSARIDKKLLN